MKTTTLPRHELIIDRASNLVSMDEYVHRVKDLVRASIQYDPTLVLHSDDAIAGKYHHSMVIMEGDHMIANTSIYPTSMKPLDTLLDTNGNPITVGECGSTVVDIEKRYSGIWKTLSSQATEILGREYNVLVSATINGAMEKIRKSLGFQEVPFPNEYYEEGKRFLSPLLPWGLPEFERRAKCLMQFRDGDESYKQHVLEILNNQ